MSKILIADDERAICRAFASLLDRDGHTPLIAASGEEALRLVEREAPDLVFLDVRMPGIGGLAALEQIRALAPATPVVVMTAYGTIETALEAMRLGAFDYLGKPLDLSQVRALIRRALHRPVTDGQAAAEAVQETPEEGQDQALVGQSAPMQETFKLIGLLTTNDLTVLITGESGVGKELAARAIHDHSARRDYPFVAVNCAAIPEQLLESELFGHEKGAFTGADRVREGRFESAGEGTIFLDEVGDLPSLLQAKLLRVLQTRQFERVGSNEARSVKARVLTATNHNLEDDVAQGRFREDLFHRLNLVRLHLPPLRTRSEDVPLLARHFLRRANHQLGKRLASIEKAALRRLAEYGWPGNVRELENALQRASLQARGEVLTIHDVEAVLPKAASTPPNRVGDDLDRLGQAAREVFHHMRHEKREAESEGIYHRVVGYVEGVLIGEALRVSNDNQVSASRLLGLHRTTLRKKLG